MTNQETGAQRDHAEQLRKHNGHHALVLCIGDDAHLLATRCLLLVGAGYEALCYSSMKPPDERAMKMASIVLLCHSIDESKVQGIVGKMRAVNPQLKFVGVMKFLDHVDGGSCKLHDRSPAAPERLLEVLQRITLSDPSA